MKDTALAETASRLGTPVHLLAQLHDDSWPACGSKAVLTLTSANPEDVTCPVCLGLPLCPCGRIDDHDSHEWRRPRYYVLGRLLPAKRYWCCGTPPTLEGGAR